MKYISLTLFLLLPFGAAFSQLKPLTLEESVIGQYRQFYPEQKAVVWIPETDTYAYIENDAWYLANPASKALPQLAISLADFNKKTGHNLTSLSETEWTKLGVLQYSMSSTTEKDMTEVYEFNVTSGTTALKYKYPSAYENVVAHESGKSCYTKTEKTGSGIVPSLKFMAYFNNQEHTICTNPDGIVTGQSVSRNEYGISNGSFWSPKGTLLAFYQKDERKVTTYPLVDYKATPAVVKQIKYPMAGDQSEIIRVGIYNSLTDKTVYLKLNGGKEDDQYYATNLAWSPDEKYVIVAELNRQTTVCKVNLYDALTGNLVRTLFTETDNKWVEPDQAPYFLDNTTFLWYSWRGGFHNYYLYDIDGRLLSNTNANFELLEILKVSSDKNLIYLSGTGKNASEKHAFVWDIKAKSFNALTQDAGTHDVKISGSGAYFLDQFQSMNTPNRVSIHFSKDGKVANTLLASEDKLIDYAIGKTEIFTINANNGVPLYCRLIKPSNFDPKKKYPVLVYVYNGPHVQLVTNTYLGGASLWMNYLAEKGYLVFTVDGQGSAHRGKAFEQIIHRQLGEQEMADQLSGVEWLKKQTFVDAERMAIHGWSFGGFMTTSLMTKKPGTFKVGVAGGPVIDWRLYEVMYTERYMDTPQENKEGFDKTNCLNYVNQLQGKLLMIHGADDDVVVLQHNARFLEMCVKKNKEVDFFLYPGHAHNVRGKDRVHLMNKIIEYITDNL